MTDDYCSRALEFQHPYHVNSTSIQEQLLCSSYFYGQAISWERPFTISLLALGIIVGIVGNILVIIASSKYGTFKLDRITITLVKNLAIADLGIVLMYDIPILSTHIAQRWVMGLHMCYVVGFGFMVPAMANLMFTMLVSIHRYVRCKWPLKASPINPQNTTLFVVSMWSFSTTLWVSYSCATKLRLEFLSNAAFCIYTFLEENRWAHFVFMCSTLINCFVMIFTNVSMWCMVRESLRWNTKDGLHHKRELLVTKQEDVESASGKELKEFSKPRESQPQKNKEAQKPNHNKAPATRLAQHSKALLTTTVVTSFFLVSWIPTLIRYFIASWPYTVVIPPAALDKLLPITFSLGSWLNPLIYTLINKSFREFVSGKIKIKIAHLSHNN